MFLNKESEKVLGSHLVTILPAISMAAAIAEPAIPLTLLSAGATMLAAKVISTTYTELGSHYHSENKKICLERVSREDLLPKIAHEYSHYIQDSAGFAPYSLNIFSEGHARGIQRSIAQLLREREDNDAFLTGISSLIVSELKIYPINGSAGEEEKRLPRACLGQIAVMTGKNPLFLPHARYRAHMPLEPLCS